MVRGLKGMTYDTRISVLVLLSLRMRRLMKDLVTIVNYLKSSYRKDRAILRTIWLYKRVRGNTHKLQQNKFQLQIRKNILHSGRGQTLEQTAVI